jgi:hypothetical protein
MRADEARAAGDEDLFVCHVVLVGWMARRTGRSFAAGLDAAVDFSLGRREVVI